MVCADVTLNAVATALGIELRDATIVAEVDLDFRGTLGGVKGGGPSWFSEYSSAIRSRHGCFGRANCQSTLSYRALLCCRPDAHPFASDRSKPSALIIC